MGRWQPGAGPRGTSGVGVNEDGVWEDERGRVAAMVTTHECAQCHRAADLKMAETTSC